MRKFCELNVKESPSLKQNVENVKQLIELGYQTVAIAFEHGQPVKQIKGSKVTADELINKMKTLLSNIMLELRQYENKTNEFMIPKDFRLLSRINYELINPDQVPSFRSNYYRELEKEFDIISLYPQNEKMFRMAVEGKINIDIISLRLENSLYRFTNEIMSVGIKRGIGFEICYSQMIKSETLRKYIIKNGRFLVSKTKKSKGIFLSSGGENILDFRSPLDVVNLADLFSIKGGSCYDMLEATCQRLVLHAMTRKKTFLGSVMVEKIENEANEKDEPVAKRQKMEID